MERLTKRGTRKNGYVSAIGSGFGCWGEIIDRLAAYEDTGLMPEEIKEFMEDVEMRFVLWVEKRWGISAGKHIDIMQAEKDGRLVIESPTAPLTLEELWEMGQRCEGVYVAHMDGSPVFRGQKHCAAVLDFSLTFGSNAMHVHAIYGDRMTLREDDYGKTWLAYRRKPEEGTM